MWTLTGGAKKARRMNGASWSGCDGAGGQLHGRRSKQQASTGERYWSQDEAGQQLATRLPTCRRRRQRQW